MNNDKTSSGFNTPRIDMEELKKFKSQTKVYTMNETTMVTFEKPKEEPTETETKDNNSLS